VVQGDIVYSKKPHVERSVKERRDERKGEASVGREGYSHLGGKTKNVESILAVLVERIL
jgi:hypothetical protein